MRSHDACIASTPAYWTDMSTAGRVEVRPLPPRPGARDWSGRYFHRYGAFYVPWWAWRGDEALIALLSYILELLVFDGIRPEELHREFRKIDEYRRLFSLTGHFEAEQFARLDYFQTHGTSEIGWGALRQDEALIAVMSYAVQLLVFDKITPNELHSEFMKVDLYRQRFGSGGRPFAHGRFPTLNA